MTTLAQSEVDQVIVLVWTRLQVRATIQDKSEPLPEGLLVKTYSLAEFHPEIFELEEFSGVLGEQPRQAVIDTLTKANNLPLLENDDPWLLAWCERKFKSGMFAGEDADLLLEMYAKVDGFRLNPWAMLAR